jgi:predicted CxxxxCH...CXXCH cytochrome family protein
MTATLALALLGCDSQLEQLGRTTTDSTASTLSTTQTLPPGFQEGQFCVVRSVFEVGCVTGCHSAVVSEGGLDLHTDPYTATVLHPSQDGTQNLVVPGDPDASLLYQLMLGNGSVMPPQGRMDDFFLVPVKAWIEAGAPNDCDGGYVQQTATETGRHHPPGWEASDVHGLAAKLQTDGDCRSCHGAQLDGGTAGVSCDDCHTPGWRTDCTFCHGGTLNQTGAPPRDMDNQDDPQLISFRAHPEHVAGPDHPPYDCTQCHYKPSDVLTPGHVFDDVTAGYGELDYTGGLSYLATYYQGTCSNLYCHGTGLVLGTATDGQSYGCASCHPDQYSPAGDWNQMSGRHKQHLDQEADCSTCHSQVVNANETVVGPQYHVNGSPDVLPTAVTWDGTTCTGSCHGHNHDHEGWL